MSAVYCRLRHFLTLYKDRVESSRKPIGELTQNHQHSL